MNPYLDDGDIRLYQGDVLETLRELPDESVHCVVTSPPYWGLRDYGTGSWEGGNPDCDHETVPARNGRGGSGSPGKQTEGAFPSEFAASKCGRCGATRTDQQLGLEPTPDEYVANMVEVFREVRRVLRSDGTCWLNMGDSYAGSWGAQSREKKSCLFPLADGRRCLECATCQPDQGLSGPQIAAHPKQKNTGSWVNGHPTLKPKDLCMIPARLALALQADGWWLRSQIVWSKPNPMPESVTDRPTTSHEFVFLLAKGPRYFFDQEAVREPNVKVGTPGHLTSGGGGNRHENYDGMRNRDFERAGRQVGHHGRVTNEAGRNLRSVWEIPTQPYPEAHFATYPEELVRRCILAGTSERGCCPECGAPWVRETKYGPDANRPQAKRAMEIAEREGLTEEHIDALRACGISDTGKALVTTHGTGRNDPDVQALADHARSVLKGYAREFLIRGSTETMGWHPSCFCGHERGPDGEFGGGGPRAPIPCTVLDPFGGSGTSGLVARKHGRHAVLIELNPEYCRLIAERTRQLSLLAEGL